MATSRAAKAFGIKGSSSSGVRERSHSHQHPKSPPRPLERSLQRLGLQYSRKRYRVPLQPRRAAFGKRTTDPARSPSSIEAIDNGRISNDDKEPTIMDERFEALRFDGETLDSSRPTGSSHRGNILSLPHDFRGRVRHSGTWLSASLAIGAAAARRLLCRKRGEG